MAAARPAKQYERQTVEILRIDHFTFQVAPEELDSLLDFYSRVIGLEPGPRPAFAFPGHWLYAEGRPIVHLAGNAPPRASPTAGAVSTGKLNHISLRTKGLQIARERLAAHGIEWKEAPVPGFPLHQIFFIDPVGLKIELTFDAAEVERAGPSPKPAAD